MTFCNLTYDKFSITFWPIKITRTWIIILHVQRKVGETRGWFKYFHLHKQTRHFLSKCMISCKGQMIRWFIVNLPVSHACVFCLKLYSRPVRCFFYMIYVVQWFYLLVIICDDRIQLFYCRCHQTITPRMIFTCIMNN